MFSLSFTLLIPVCCLLPFLSVSTACSIAWPTVSTSLLTTVPSTVCSIALFYCLLHCALLLSVTLYVTQSVAFSDSLCFLHCLPLLVLPAFYTAQPTVLPSSLTVCLLFYNINYPTVCSSLLTIVHCCACSIACSIASSTVSSTVCSTVSSAVYYTVRLTACFTLLLLHCKFLYIFPY